MAVSGSDVPGKYDVVIDVGGTKTGYTFDETIDPQARLFGKKKASYSYSPTFVERQNVQGNYGDDSQAFWLTASQNDWSLGEDQRFFRANDQDSVRTYWQGSAADVTKPGQVNLRYGVSNLTFAAAPVTGCPTTNRNVVVATSTNLYEIAYDGTITDRNAHGLGAAPSRFGSAFDGGDIYLTTETAGTVGVRKNTAGSTTYATFSASAATSLEFHNNSLYGWVSSNDSLVRWDSAGTRSTLFSWVGADGLVGTAPATVKLKSFGGKLLILRATDPTTEIWLYDGLGVTLLHRFQPNFLGYDMVVDEGIVYVSGGLQSNTAGGVKFRPAIMYYANGTPGMLWRGDSNAGTQMPVIAAWDGGVVWSDATSFRFVYYNPATGGVHRIGTYGGAENALVAGKTHFLLIAQSSTTGYLFPNTASYVSSATVTSSLFDFDSSLDKLFRGVKADFTAATDGDGGSVDIAYRVGDVDGSYTTLQTGAVSGTEYTLSSVTGRNISVKITLNKGTSTSGPTLKRVYVRAVPVLRQNKQRVYTFSCFGDPSDQNAIQRLRDGTPNPKTGREQADALITAVTSTTPITIYDRFSPGGYTAVLEPSQCEVIEIHAEPRIPPVKSGSFIVIVTAREA